MVRVAPLRHVPEVLSGFGLPIEPLLDEVGLPGNAFTQPEGTVAVEAAARLIAICAERTNCPHFGLLVGQKAMLASLGLIGLSMLHSADVGVALRGLILTLHLHGRTVVPTLVVRDDVAVLGVSLYGDRAVGARQVADLSIAIACNLMRAMCGSKWVPDEVLFSHRAPADRRPYSRPSVEIVARLNYTDASTFTRAFRAWSGTTPTSWRASRIAR